MGRRGGRRPRHLLTALGTELHLTKAPCPPGSAPRRWARVSATIHRGLGAHPLPGSLHVLSPVGLVYSCPFNKEGQKSRSLLEATPAASAESQTKSHSSKDNCS